MMNMNFGEKGKRERERIPFPKPCREGGNIFLSRKQTFRELPFLLSLLLDES